MAEPKVTVDEHGRAEGENVARSPEPKVKAETLTMDHVNERVAKAKAAIAKQPPRPLTPGDWASALQAISNLTERVKHLEAGKASEPVKK